MSKRKWGISLLLIVCFIGLAGCSGKVAGDNELEKKTAERAKEDEEKSKEEAKEEEQAKEEEKKEEVKPVVVNVIDPNTKAVLKTFSPAEMGFGGEDEKYKAELAQWAKEIARGTDAKQGYDQRMTLDKLGPDGKIIKGQPEIILEESELVQRIIDSSVSGGDVELPLYVSESGYDPADVPYLGEVVVASYTTRFNSGVAGRTKNIELSAEAINNIILGVGDHFSFNTTVGPSDEAHGYQPAEEAINGKLVMGIGGGICQTSSTLFNAVDKVGVSYVEKHHHSVTVGYVPKGRDATVSYGGKDFRFENTTGIPLLVKANFGNGVLTIEIRTAKKYEGLLKKAV
ncbi:MULTISPECIES: VanW family protein [Cytobacillus]|jgi:vancomycin resistance protein YoaR|uniref:VanW family protein n=1 Tax=Cytobacillus TaxID=2675230 RepID=UPI00203E324E|nr:MULTISPECIES: VanW family protein [Cytobacillus]MCM3394388.1 VanW family protein [Cytobacillus oceanisediminis]UQX55900.1 VanW family protein [Cytobacillus pseudoceanisediminis]